MKITTALYAALAVVGATAVVLVPLTMYRSGSPALPAWRAAVMPGPLSAAHAFLGGRCESCHAPDRGVEAAACLTCHTFAPELLAKQNTAFHATVGECAACHVEHKGGDRPTRMDHGALVAAGAAGRPDQAERGSLAALERLLDEAGAALGPPGAALPAKQAERLDCADLSWAAGPAPRPFRRLLPVLPYHRELGRGGLAASLAALDRLRTVPPAAAQPCRGALPGHGTAGRPSATGADRTVLPLPPDQQLLQLTARARPITGNCPRCRPPLAGNHMVECAAWHRLSIPAVAEGLDRTTDHSGGGGALVRQARRIRRSFPQSRRTNCSRGTQSA